MHMEPMSHWNDNKNAPDKNDIATEYEGFNHWYDKNLSKPTRNSKNVYMIGNHEDWARQYAESNPSVKGYVGLEKNLRFKERKIEAVPFNNVYKLGRMHFTHGFYTVDHHTKKMCQNYRKSIYYGHVHDVQQYTHISPIDEKDYHTAQSVGCLCKVNPSYMKSRPNRWVHGFLAFYMKNNKEYSAYQIRIVNGEFIWQGKVFK